MKSSKLYVYKKVNRFMLPYEMPPLYSSILLHFIQVKEKLQSNPHQESSIAKHAPEEENKTSSSNHIINIPKNQ